MTHRRAGRSIWCASHTGLIGKKSPLDPDHHSATRKPSENRPSVKGFPEDQRKDFRNPSRIHHHGGKPHEQVAARHHRHDHRSDKSDPVDPAENNKSRSCRQHGAYNSRINTVRIPRNIIFQGRGHIKRLQPVKPVGKTDDQQYRKYNSEISLPKRLLHIIRRSASEVFSIFHLVHLCQGTLNKGGCTADHSHHPHPEHSAGASGSNGCGNSGNVAGSHSGGSGYHQCLKRGYLFFAVFHLRFFKQHAKSFAKQASLYKAGPHGKIHAGTHKQYQ